MKRVFDSRWLRASLLLVVPLGKTLSAPPPGEFIARVFTNADGGTLSYRLLAPQHYEPAKEYPLVVFFHGAGERGTDNIAQLTHGAKIFLTPEHRTQYPCFVFAPQCPPNQQWVDMPWGGYAGTRPEKPSASMQLALDAKAALQHEFRIDPNRVYVTGLSMGGYATWDGVTRHPELFAAAAPVCGGGDEKTVTPAVARVPIWAFHSVDDPVVVVERTRSMVAAMRNAGGHPKYFEYFGLGHGSWDRAYAETELLPWMFAQRLGQPDTYALKSKAPELPPVARFPADADFPGRGPIRKMDWFRTLWIQRRIAWWLHREKDQGAVVFLGDSITQGWGRLAKEFPGMKTANRGISGDVTRGVLCRMKEDVLDLNPKAVVLLIGTNDLEENGDPGVIADNVREIITACARHDPRMPMVVCKVMPSSASQRRPADQIQRLNELVDDIVKANPPCVRCDTYSIFANDRGDAKREEFPDLLHPNAAGYAKWAAALRPIFAALSLTER